jgi:hypothetical protein
MIYPAAGLHAIGKYVYLAHSTMVCKATAGECEAASAGLRSQIAARSFTVSDMDLEFPF